MGVKYVTASRFPKGSFGIVREGVLRGEVGAETLLQ